MISRVARLVVASGLLLNSAALPGYAAPVALPPFTSGGGNVAIDFNGISPNASNGQIRDYMNGQLSTAGVSGQVTSVTGASGDRNYDGEGFVVGPRGASGQVTSLTLGNTDAGLQHSTSGDRFLINFNADLITMVFDEPIYGIAFDYEIFPNGDVPNGVGVDPERYPDFTFNAYSSGTSLANRLEHFHVFSVLPGTNGTYPSSPNNLTERAPQLLGSASFVFSGGATVLQFIDWPERIGIDNLLLSFAPAPAPTPIPEPSALLVWTLLVGGGVAVCRQRLAITAK